jgi:hypothetical protein
MRFDFNLARDAPGWADPVFEFEETSLSMTASYITDALGDLLGALVLLVNGSSTAECEWTQEPGGWRWNFSRPTITHVDLVIAFKDDAFTRPWEPHDPGETRLKLQRLLLRELVEAVTAGARRCLDDFGAPGFAKQWNMHPFPLLQLEALQTWVEVDPTAPLFEPDW